MEWAPDSIQIATANPRVIDCLFEDHEALGGGAVGVFNGDIEIIGSTFRNNVAYQYGGAVVLESTNDRQPLLRNCLFVSNRALTSVDRKFAYGGGVTAAHHANPIIENCTFVGNEADLSGGSVFLNRGASADIVNTILWEGISPEGPEVHVDEGGLASIDYSVVMGGLSGVDGDVQWGIGNLEEHPQVRGDP